VGLSATSAERLCSAPPTATAVATCGAIAPAVGVTFSGPVLQVVDGATICVAQGPTPSQWIKTRLSGIDAVDNRAELMRAVFGRRVVCIVDRKDADGAVARCTLDATTISAD
jgi:endonuclease YncB( thermonuclease family)